MVEELLKGLYRIEVVLPRSPLKYLNCYVVKGDGRFLIIDTGMNRPECLEALTSGLKELAVDLDRADFFITHVHSDHSGLLGIAREGSKVYMSQIDSSIVNAPPGRRGPTYKLFLSSGFPAEELTAAINAHPGRLYAPRLSQPFDIVKDGDYIRVGEYAFRCVATPGHSPEHICLYEADKKVLVAGDTILIDITPNIMPWPELPNSLQNYLDSLDKLYKLDVKLTLPGHRRLIEDHRKRIGELKAHHENRLEEVLRALTDGPKKIYDIAPLITWDIQCDSWQSFPTQQKWFAVGETTAHLFYLEALGRIRRITENETVTFGLSK